MTAYVCLLEIALHVGESTNLKSKRKVISSLKAQLRRRFSVSVAEIDGHDTWQRSVLLCALVGGSEIAARADEIERFVVSRVGDTCTFERDVLSLADVRG